MLVVAVSTDSYSLSSKLLAPKFSPSMEPAPNRTVGLLKHGVSLALRIEFELCY